MKEPEISSERFEEEFKEFFEKNKEKLMELPLDSAMFYCYVQGMSRGAMITGEIYDNIFLEDENEKCGN
jgi:menaquinone-dependent protoporphyrinogen IX oxidase